MAIEMTYHGGRPREGSGALLDALPAQVGAAAAVASGSVSAALTSDGLYRIRASADCRVRCGDGTLTNAAGGEVWGAGSVEVRYLAAGSKIAVGAL